MLTTRGWWFLIVVLSLLTVGIFDQPLQPGRGAHWTLILLMLTLLLWFLGEWLLFALRVYLVVPAVHLQREIHDARGPVATLWAGRSFRVVVQLRLRHWGSLPCVKLWDRVPLSIERSLGDTEADGALTGDEQLSLAYSVRCPAAGRVRFEGVGIQIADLQGFFHYATFIPGVMDYRVLPPLADAEGHRPTVKRYNLLPSPGQHRHLRPGSGSELLDLRDYLVGDPPKTIAWKISARRDRLITKEFESEVPVRCTLFVDASHSVRIGPPGRNALARLVEIAAAAAQANAGVRDLTGICLFDEKGVTRYIRPARGSRCLVQILNVLADAAGLAPATGEGRIAQLLPLAYTLAQEVYPYLLRPDLNQVPLWSARFWPVPTHPASRSRIRVLVRGFFLLLASIPLAGTGFIIYLLITSGLLDNPGEPVLPVPNVLWWVIAWTLAISMVTLYYRGVLFAYGALGQWLSSRKRRLARWRKRLAAILVERYRLGPGALGILLEDDEHFSLCMQRFLAEHQVPYPLPFYDREGRYLFASPGKIPVLAGALVRAVGKGHDNELFVLLVDLLELVDQLGPLLSAVKTTLARHHKVMVICPWPPGVPPPPAGETLERGPPSVVDIRQLRYYGLWTTTTRRLHRAFARLQRAFVRLGVPVICAQSGDPVRLILKRRR